MHISLFIALCFLITPNILALNIEMYIDLKECPSGQCTGPAPPPDNPTDIVSNGNYLITNCLYQQPGDLATPLIDNLRSWGQSLPKVVSSLNDFTGQWAYPKYLKDLSNKAPASYIFNKILNGDNVNYNGQPQQPTLTCARDGSPNPSMQQIWKWCNPSTDISSNPHAFHLQGSQTIILCPKYFAQSSQLPLICPVPWKGQVAQNQFGILIHELVHLYGDEPAGQHALGGETEKAAEYTGDDGAKYLPAEKQRISPGNYALYAGSVIAGCQI